jgi:hypothetical protein
MDEFGSFASVIALWIGVSCGLWWLHRRSVHAKQRRQMRQAVRAAAYVSDAQKIFDTIRRRPPAAGNATSAALTAETHALLKRIQDRSGFFDKVNVLRVDMLAAFGIEDYPPLSEILHIRRDLWAASEILLVEDLSSFGASFTEEGAYERFRAEATALLFKADGAASGDEDVIDLRLSLARGEAERLVPELKDAIRLARERDRLPTFAEIVAYPVGAIRAIPGQLRIARTFLSEFYGYAAEIAGAIRRSEAMERGVSELRRAREELPQRLVTGFERASDAARQSASGLRRHYDFLVAAHDFQAKYEQTLRRAPQITERGRQFIARLELAEHSERLRLTSANFLIWLTRQLATGLAYFIAGLQQLHTVLSETPPGILAAALVAPTPIRGRHLPAFRSYRMALGMSGLTEPRPVLPVAAGKAVALMHKKAGKSTMVAAPAKEKGKRGKAPTAKSPKAAPVAKAAKVKEPASAVAVTPPPAKAKKLDRPIEAARSVSEASAAKSVPTPSARLKPATDKAEARIEPRPAPDKVTDKPAATAVAATPPAAKPVKASPPAPKEAAAKKRDEPGKPVAAPAISKPAELKPAVERTEPHAASETAAAPAAQKEPVRPAPVAAKRNDAETLAPKSESAAEIDAPTPVTAEPQTATFPPEKRRSFLDRLLGRRPPEPTIGDLLAAAWEREHAGETGDKVAAAAPAETAPTLLAKLSELPAEELPEANEDEDDSQDEPVEEDDAEDEMGDDPESLTSSVMEVQAKLTPKPPQIRSFPWLRG